jgi:hypothetical protein
MPQQRAPLSLSDIATQERQANGDIGGLAGQDAGQRQHPVGSIPPLSNA